ncbi:hypothetical protein JHD46_07905 [Sulfurimonas sp. SAG-AH-194-C20]|nr:hypothetical protein [Sulfurimonas sp. SAG-AH-194-C20]MDF1879557.1 hypothetical protein [Sulfurimonas sp. SAG-AH-194-C20]
MSYLNKVSKKKDEIILSKAEKEKEYKDAVEGRGSALATVAGTGAGMYGVGRAGSAYLRKKTEADGKSLSKELLDDNLHGRQSKMTDDNAKTVKGFGSKRLGSTVLSLMHGSGKYIGAVGLGAYGVDKLTQHFDKKNEGLFDKKTTTGKRDKHLVGTGTALSAVGGLGGLYLARKGRNAFIRKDFDLANPVKSFEERQEKLRKLKKEDPFLSNVREEKLEKRRLREDARDYAKYKEETKDLTWKEAQPLSDANSERDNARYKAYHALGNNLRLRQRAHSDEHYNDLPLTDEMTKGMANVTDAENAKTVAEYIKARKRVQTETVTDLATAAKEAGMQKRDLRLTAITEGLKASGGVGVAAGLGLGVVPGAKSYSDRIKDKKEEKKKNKNKKLQKKAILGAGAIHLGQAQLYKALTETNMGRKHTAQFLKDRFTEGYTGKRVGKENGKASSAFAKTLNFLKQPVTLNGIRNTSVQSKRNTIKAKRLSQDVGRGAAYHLMPEAAVAAKEARHIGKKLKDSDVDISKLTKADKDFMTSLANGDLKAASSHAAEAPMAIELLGIALPSVEHRSLVKLIGEASLQGDEAGMKVLSSEFKKTRMQPIMKALSDSFHKDGISKTNKTRTLESAKKGEDIGYNSSHAVLGVLDPATAILNGTKRYMTSDKLSKEKVPAAVANIYNGGKSALNMAFSTAPGLSGKAKGYLGKEYKQGALGFVSKNTWSPAISQASEDSHRLALMQRKYLEALPKTEETTSKLKKIKETGKMVSEKGKRYSLTNPMVEGYEELKSSKAGKYVSKALNSVTEASKTALHYTPYRAVSNIKKDIGKATSSLGEGNASKLVSSAIKMRSSNPDIVAQGRKEMGEAQKASGRHRQDDLNEVIDNLTDKGLKGVDKAVEEASRLNERYKRWALPGTAIGATALTAPMISSYYDRNKKPSGKNNGKLKKDKEVA